MYLEKLQNAGLLLVAALKPGKSLLVVAESQISIYKGGSRNVACLLAPFQFPEKPKCISPSPGVGIRPDKDTDDTRATIRNRYRLLQYGDGFRGLAVSDQRETKKPKGHSIVRSYCQHAAQLAYRIIVAAGLEQNPADVNAGNRKRVVLTGSLSPGQRLIGTLLT